MKVNDKKLEESEHARKAAEEHLEEVREQSRQQLAMLRAEVEWHVKNSVEAEEKMGQVQKDLDDVRRDCRGLQDNLEQKRKREASLERMIVSERNRSKALVDEISRLREHHENNEKDRSSLMSQMTRLKVENATLQEREKLASVERTMLESRIAEVDKKLQYSSEDVAKKVEAERRRLEKLGLEKLEETQRRHQAEIDRLKKEHSKKLQDTLLTYVCAEEYARLETKFQEALKRAQDAEDLLAEKQALLQRATTDLERVKEQKNDEIAAERRRRDKLQKRLAAQKQSYNDIRQELETYRQLIESLDLDSETLANTPIGAKRSRTSLGASCSNRMNATFSKSTGTPPTNGGAPGKGRQALLRKVLTPKRTPKPSKAQPAAAMV